MQCPRCRTETDDGSGVCAACGAAISVVCSCCGTSNAPGAKFCSECGLQLYDKPASGSRANGGTSLHRTAPVSTAGERRQLTIMVCDLVGSTALAARLDPEDLREVIGTFHRAIADVVAASGGFVARYIGDGSLIYFCYFQEGGREGGGGGRPRVLRRL